MISAIVAITKNRVIGNNGKIPWRIKGEQKRFRELTTGNVIIMGRKSYEEIGKPLPNRFTVLISKTLKVEAENCHTVESLEEALEYLKDTDKEIYIAGGAAVYEAAMPYVDRVYLTVIDAELEGDRFFKEFEDDFEMVDASPQEGDIPYTYYIYDRKKN